MTDRSWRTLRVQYLAPAKDDLILDAVKPFFDEVESRVEAAYFTRHWRRGSHLRLNFRCGRDDWRVVVRVAKQIVGDYLVRHPSSHPVDERRDLERHRVLAVREHDNGALEPFVPDNTLLVESFEERRHVLGSDRLGELMNKAYVESSKMVFDTLDMVRRGGASKFEAALDLMFAFAVSSVRPVQRGYMSFRSHADSFLSYTESRDLVSESFKERYEELRQPLHEWLRRTVRQDREPDEQPDHVRAWLDFVTRRKREAAPLFDNGEIDLDHCEQPGMTPLHRTEFRDLLASTTRHHDEILSTTWFRCHRLAVNLLYSHLSRLGITPLQRYLFCSLLSCTVENEYGFTPLERAEAYLAGGRRPIEE